jgi:hypothetical protein
MPVVVDTRELEYPVVTIRHDKIILDVQLRETYAFSHRAWSFFTNNLEALLSLDPRAQVSNQNVLYGSETKRLLVNEDHSVGMEIYPGPHVDEWFVAFFEIIDDLKIRFQTRLRTASGRGGSVYKKDQLMALFQPIEGVD